jgi:hypothetical protein
VIITPRQQAVALVASVALLVFIVDLVRRRKLREEYSWLWIATGLVLLVLSAWYRALVLITRLIGAVAPISTFFLFGILFLVAINIHYSMKISSLTSRVKNLAQRLAIVDEYTREMREREAAPAEPRVAPEDDRVSVSNGHNEGEEEAPGE